MNTRLLFCLLWLTPLLCQGASFTSYFLNIEALTNSVARNEMRALTSVFTNSTTVNGSLITGVANPSGLIGMSAVNGVATTLQRSDSRQAIDPAIDPTFTGSWIFAPTASDIGPIQTNSAASQAGYTINQFTGATNAALSVNTAGASQFKLYGEAANTLALRNGVNANVLKIYDTFTDSSNYKRLFVGNASGSSWVVSEGAGTGGAGNNLKVGTLGAAEMHLTTSGAIQWKVTTGGNFLAETDNADDIGAAGANRPKDVYVADDVVAGGDVTAGALLQNSGIRVMTPSTLQTLAAANALLANATKVRVVGSGGAVTLTSTPTIADGTDGQYVMIQGTDDTNTLTVQDQGSLASSNLELGAATRVLGAGDVLCLTFDSTASVWYEVSFANN